MIALHRRLAIVAALATAAPVVRAQTPAARFVDSARTEIDRGVQDMDMARLDKARVLLDRALVAFPDDPYLLHYRGYLAYRQATALLMMGDKTNLGAVITQALGDLGKSAESLKWPETLQLEACLIAMRIPLEPGSGMTLGPASGRMAADASKLGPSNPRVALLQAYVAEGTPSTMGGGLEKARALVTRSLKLFGDDHPAPLAPSWGMDEARALQARLDKSNERKDP